MTTARLPHSALAIASCFLAAFFTSCSTEPSEDNPTPPIEAATLSIPLTLKTPSAGWSLKAERAFQTKGGQVICIWQLTRPEGMASQVISSIEGAVTLPTVTGAIHHFVLGKTWGWDANPHVTFIDSIDQIQQEIQDARPIDIAK